MRVTLSLNVFVLNELRGHKAWSDNLNGKLVYKRARQRGGEHDELQ